MTTNDPTFRPKLLSPRLVLSTKRETFKITKDPFVTHTRLGYTPAILVRRPEAGQQEHVLISAKSISDPVEDIRQRHGTLIGRMISIRKTGTNSKDPFEVREED